MTIGELDGGAYIGADARLAGHVERLHQLVAGGVWDYAGKAPFDQQLTEGVVQRNTLALLPPEGLRLTDQFAQYHSLLGELGDKSDLHAELLLGHRQYPLYGAGSALGGNLRQLNQFRSGSSAVDQTDYLLFTNPGSSPSRVRYIRYSARSGVRLCRGRTYCVPSRPRVQSAPIVRAQHPLPAKH